MRLQRMVLKEPDDHSKRVLMSTSWPQGCRVCSWESLPLGQQLQHEWRHMEVSAGIHKEGGRGAGALSEGAEDWGGSPHTQCLPKLITFFPILVYVLPKRAPMITFIRPGWCDSS